MFTLTGRQSYEFDLAGYVIIREFLPQDLVRRLNGAINDHQVGQWPRKFSILHLGDDFLSLMAEPRALAICQEWLGEWFRLDNAFGIQDAPSEIPKPGAQEDLHAGPFSNQGAFWYAWAGGVRGRGRWYLFIFWKMSMRAMEG